MDRRSFLGSLGALFATGLLTETAIAQPPGAKAAEALKQVVNDPRVREAYELGEGGSPPAARIDVHYCTDVQLMFEAIVAHARSTSDIILSANDALDMAIGFMSIPEKPSGRANHWKIGIVQLGHSLDRWENAAKLEPAPTFDAERIKNNGGMPTSDLTRIAILRIYLGTPEGQKKLAAAFSGQRSKIAPC